MTDLQALILDFDGLILDTETANHRAWCEAYAAFGLEMPLEKWALCIGTDWNAFDPMADLAAQVGETFDAVGFRKGKDVRTAELIAVLPPRPGIPALLRRAAAEGIRLGVASSSPRAWVEGHLERLGLRPYFSAVKAAEDVERVKPDPALYLSCLDALGAEASRSTALEDSPNGIRAAKAAGMFVVAYPNPVTVRLDLSQADLRMSDGSEWKVPGWDYFRPRPA
jgi:HAD superfamily hydrolase (TIGR01509 family)